MIKICEICENKFETKNSTRIYCLNCHKDIHSEIVYIFD